ncbi:MAG TPA: response regulator [Polyangia bacterium]|jgi:CheY-like chemotaxis protein|nr:response regulator [Polyangia bacterium]
MSSGERARQILVVEDDRDIRESLDEVLREAGYVPALATNGAEALEHLRIAPFPDVILLDLMMPVMDGREFRRIQLSDDRLREIPTILLTAHAKPADAMSGMGDIVFLAKPVDLDRLLETIARVDAKAVR